jgi:hypothetical protein
MKKAKSKKRESDGLVLGKDFVSYPITPRGEPNARVIIRDNDIDGLEYETDWKKHSLVRVHGCAPEGAEIAVRSAFVAHIKTLASPLHEETHHFCEQYAVRRFWGEDESSISQRFRDLAEDLEELEGIGGWKPKLRQFVTRLSNAGRKPIKGKSMPKLVEEWLLNNWVSGKMVCLLNNRQISEKLAEDQIKCDSKKLDEQIRALGLEKPKRPTRERGYRTHSR